MSETPSAKGTIGVVVLVDYARGARMRGFGRLAFGRWRLGSVPGLTFRRFMGAGAGGGFGLSHQGLFLAFTDDVSATAFLATSPLIAHMRADADAWFSVKLRAYSSRGRWSGVEPFPAHAARPASGPIAVLTRASIRPSKVASFWRHAPPAQADLGHADGCRLAIGLGEMPLFRQATFTLWDSEAHVAAYAQTGAHLAAIKAARAGCHFTEDMFTRFVPSEMTGSWPHGPATPGTVTPSVAVRIPGRRSRSATAE
jgi:hypothetical protein